MLSALLLASVAALLAVGIRLASLAAPQGLERSVAAVVIAAGAAGLQALALGLVGLGGSPVALGAAAVGSWVAGRALLPTPSTSVGEELASWWAELEPGARAAIGAAVGVGAAYAVWVLRYPSFGLDGVVYHLTESVMWAQQGSPGSIELITYEFPVGNYPVVYELLIGWSSAVGRSLPPTMLWTPGMLALFAAAGWLGLRELRVPRLPATLALLAVAALPVTVDGLRGPSTDVAALGWLAAAAGLAAASARRPALMAPALVAIGLAVGTKTTTIPYSVLLVAIVGWRERAHLRGLALPLGAAGGAAAVLGGFWYLRNLFDHGSPLWPFVDTPWGDPIPAYLARFDVSFLARPIHTLDGRVGQYLEFLGGGPMLVACALVAVALVRRRAVAAGAAATVLGVLAWAQSPFTGRSNFNRLFDLSLSTTRYLLPVFAVAALTLALAARERGWVRGAALVALGASASWSVVATVALTFPRAPSAGVMIAGVAAGAVAAMAVARVRPSPGATRGLIAAATAATALVIALTTPGFLERYADTNAFGAPVARWLESQPDYRDGSRPVWFAPAPVGVLAGPRLRHDIAVIPAQEGCTEVMRRAREGYIVLRRFVLERFVTRFTTDECLRRFRPVFDDGGEWRVYALTGDERATR